MTSKVRLYVEGGGKGALSRRAMRDGLGKFLKGLGRIAVIPCGPRGEAFKAFQRALRGHTDVFNALLVDSEGPVSALPWKHLAAQDGWARPGGAKDEQCHLMVQAMEAWLVADPDALAEHYGQGFKKGKLPRRRDVEAIAKSDLVPALKRATEETTKGRYHKIRHGAKLLAVIDQAKVRARAPYCKRLFETLSRALE